MSSTPDVAVEPMDEPVECRVRTRPPHPLDDTERNPAAPWTASPAGLSSAISVVLEQNRRQRDRGVGFGRVPARRRRSADRWNSKLITDVKPSIGCDTPPIHPDLTAAQNSVNVAFGNALQDPGEVVVDALALAVFAHRKPVDSILA
jgi:hypothetical protein